MAEVHHYGLWDGPSARSNEVKYEERQLLGVCSKEKGNVYEYIANFYL
ncbi:hypothetical protein [Serratia fonticola]|nr:hypothetical protein [Serratia fonticola]